MNDFLYSQEEIPPVMSVPDVARFLGIGRNQTYDLIRSGQLEALRIGRKIKITRHDLLHFLGFQI